MSNRTAFSEAKREELPARQRQALRRAITWQLITLAYTTFTVVLVSFVLGGSQAMKTAWVEDLFSTLPQFAFLIGILVIRRVPDRDHPFGWHRAMSIGHLLAGFALLGVGGVLGFEAISNLISGEGQEIGEMELFGHTFWQGWAMIAVMAIVMIGPFFYGPAKAKLAPVLHSKLLLADADMAKADWQTNVASIVGVLGIGIGLPWLDGAAALFISVGIVWDGLKNTGAAVADLMDRRARGSDGKEPDELRARVIQYLLGLDWVEDAGLRVRDEGQVFHIEAFAVPKTDTVSLDALGEAADGIAALDWKVQDVVVIPTKPLPFYADRCRDE